MLRNPLLQLRRRRGATVVAVAADFRAALVTRLLADPTIAGLVGARIRPGSLPQGSVQPALVYSVLSHARGHHLTGTDGVADALVQFDCLASTQAECITLKAAIETSIDGLTNATLSGIVFCRIEQRQERDLTEPPSPGRDAWQYRVAVDYAVKYRCSTPSPT